MSTLTAPAPRVHMASPARSDARRAHRLGQYAASDDVQTREIVGLEHPDGSTLVIDRLASTFADARLVAQLAAEEPAENARILVEIYLADATRGRCRLLTPDDFQVAFAEGITPPADAADAHDDTISQAELTDRHARSYRMEPTRAFCSLPELRWRCYLPQRQGDTPRTVTLRQVIGALESYEPAVGLTLRALARHRDDPHISLAALRAEHQRLTASPVVLNRALREAVQAALARGEVTCSEIAIRCGRVKRGPRGTVSGETSWLARRIGAHPDAGQSEPTPWVHSDTLALIARCGLGVAPNEVEL